jgi:ABC-2 type transport system permease protein
MKLRNLNIIIAREYLTRVKKRSFLLITFLGPLFFAAIAVLPSLIMLMSADEGQKIALVDQSGIVAEKMKMENVIHFTDISTENPDSAKANFVSEGYDVLMVISPLDTINHTVEVAAYSQKPLSVDLKESMADEVNKAVEDHRLGLYNVEGLKEIIEDVKSDVSVSTYTLGEDGEEKITSSEVYMVISLVLSMIIYMFVSMFSAMVMQSVIEEKSSRVVEVLVSSVRATELMFGKIIGVAGVALTQFLLWIVLTMVLVGGISAFIGFDNLDVQQTAQMVQDMNMGGMDMSQMADMQEQGGMSVILSTLSELNYGQLILGFIVYFILGYLLYASLFAAIGSSVENEADTTQLQLPVMMPLLIAFFIAFYAFKAPDSPVVFWGSMIPFTSPIVMLARIPFGVPTWELAVSIALLLGTFVLCGWASAKIYKIGILMFGKKTTLSDLWKWLRQN